MKDNLRYEDYLGKRVKIQHTSTQSYLRKYPNFIGSCGLVVNSSSGAIGVRVDGMYNQASANGVFWLHKSDLKVMDDEMENTMLKNYKYVAIVNLLNDHNKKDYGFALFESEADYIFLTEEPTTQKEKCLVVVNTRNCGSRELGYVKDIIPVENYKGSTPTAEVVGVVNLDEYWKRVEVEKRQIEIEKQKAKIEKELDAEINKRKTVEYYEKMASQYSDNPRLAELVAQLKELGE